MNYLEIQHEKLTVYAELNPKKNQLNWDLFTVQGLEDTLFCFSNLKTLNPIDSRKLVDVKQHILTSLLSQAEAELKAFIHENIDYLGYYYNGINKKHPYWFITDNIHSWGNVGPLKLYCDLTDHIDSDYWQGIFSVKCYNNAPSYSDSLITYNLTNSKALMKEGSSLLGAFYGVHKYTYLAHEQFKLGKSPAIYNEIIRIKEFLNGKKTIKIEMKNGGILEVYKIQTITQLLLFCVENGALSCYLNSIVYCKPQITEPIPINQFQALLHGRKRLEINPDNLTLYKRNLNLCDQVTEKKAC